ncbi:MAG: squalene/phytoene synthase family protein [Hyphomicrobiaceae bacterium]|nr:squalene/phytoene synthase family protein [Hyphomicrobiaceae bacterium]
MSQSAAHVSDFLKKNDRDRYFASLFLSDEVRSDVQALYAFAADISQVRARVSEPAPGEIRLQWWNDLLEGTEHGAAMANPLAEALLAAVDRYDLPITPLRRLIAAHRFDLYDDPMPDINAFEGYAGETSSILYQFACLMVNRGNDPGTADAAGHMGVAHALVDQLYAMPISAGRGQIVLPWRLFEERGATQADYLSGKASEAIVAATTELRAVARQHLVAARAALSGLSPQIRRVFVHSVVLETRLAALELHAALPFVPPRDEADWRRLARMMWWSLGRGRKD